MKLIWSLFSAEQVGSSCRCLASSILAVLIRLVFQVAVFHAQLYAVLAAVVHQAASVVELHVFVVPVEMGDVKAAVALMVVEKCLCFHVVFVFMG